LAGTPPSSNECAGHQQQTRHHNSPPGPAATFDLC
jgi:hypothetical protein